MTEVIDRSEAGGRRPLLRPRQDATEVRFSRWLAAMHLGVLAALTALVVLSLAWVSERHNDLAQASSDKMVRSAVTTFTQKMEIVVRDYSIWDEVIEAIEARDTGWLYNMAGSAAAEIGTLDLVHLHETASGWSVGWKWGTPVEGVRGLIPEGIVADLEARLAGTDPAAHPVVTAFAEMDGDIWSFAITRVVPMGELDPTVAESAYARQIHGMILSEERLASMGSAILMEDLRLAETVAPGKDYVALAGLGGAPVAWLVWSPPAPGARILVQVALPLGLGLLATLAAALVSSRFAVRSARRLETALEAAQAADRAKLEFLSNVSHELRTPMNGILGVVQLFEMTPMDKDQRELLRILSSSADTQMALISDLLDIVQLENGQRQLSREPVVPAEVAQSVVDMLRPAAEAKGLAMHLHCDPDAGRQVLGDTRAIKQIAINLLGNAVKFTNTGTVDLHLGAAERAGQMELSLAVRDTGPGIPEAHQARIFERFAQVDAAPLCRAVDGIGLGLAISQSLAERMGGRITLQSQPGAGATFTLTVRLPLAQPQATVLAEAS